LHSVKKPAETASKVVRELFDIIDRTDLPAAAVARETGCHRVSLSRWKHGLSSPTILDVEALAEVLGYELVLKPRE
jgi:transcriptional regulator with XRE-family HTH domain